MADVHRKIELQEPDDLRYLVANTRRAANEKLDEHLPRIEGEDLYRKHVEALVHEYITATFTAASANIIINGQDPSPDLLRSILSPSATTTSNITEEYEPLDAKLAARATELKRQEDELLMEIATLKRTAHGEAARAWDESYKKSLEADEEEWRVVERSREGDDEGLDMGVRNVERQERMEVSWERGVQGLEKLKVEMPGTMAKMERARRAEEYVLKEKKGVR